MFIKDTLENASKFTDEYIKSLWDQYDASSINTPQKAKVIIDSICNIQEKLTGKNHYDYFT